MAIIYACTFPEDLYYDVPRGAWARPEPDGTWVSGFTDPSQTRAGKLLHVSPRPTGRLIPRGRPAATVESAKWVGPFPMLLTGELVATNPAIARRAILVNQDPYGEGWLTRLRPTNLAAELPELLTGKAAVDAYAEWLRDQKLTCIKCAD